MFERGEIENWPKVVAVFSGILAASLHLRCEEGNASEYHPDSFSRAQIKSNARQILPSLMSISYQDFTKACRIFLKQWQELEYDENSWHSVNVLESVCRFHILD